MCGYAYEPDFLFAWPNATTGVMGGEQAALTMEYVMINSARRRGKDVDHAVLKAQKNAIIEHYDRQSDAFYTSGRLLDQASSTRVTPVRCWGLYCRLAGSHATGHSGQKTFGIARM
ncbi:MAG: hypothetical protein CM1200mP20_12990 [Pseudomonadota bacterium]|nr:MAG: hypothetical protein CM1200mP20_12990 [Pseudomonadota bacterium]